MSENSNAPVMHATTILMVRKGGRVVIGGDGQVSLGPTIDKGNARKVRRLHDGSVIAGLYAAGACASTLAQDGKGYSSGTQLGAGSFFGRRAGRAAASAATGG